MTAIRPLVQAFRATRNEVFITTARKVADMFLARRAGDHASTSAPAVAEVLLGLLALDAEAPNPRLHAVIRAWASWLRALPLDTADPNVNADGRHSELYDCAQAGFALHAFLRDPAFLQYAWAAINRIPPESRACAWRELALFPPALLSIAALLPDAHVDFSALSVTLGWRTFAPDPATSTFLQARSASGEPLHCLPLVSPHDDLPPAAGTCSQRGRAYLRVQEWTPSPDAGPADRRSGYRGTFAATQWRTLGARRNIHNRAVIFQLTPSRLAVKNCLPAP